MPDAEEEYRNETLEEGWQHCLTVPRELTCQGERLYQYPVEELKNLRGDRLQLSENRCEATVQGSFDLEIDTWGNPVTVMLSDAFTLECREGEVILTMDEMAGAGRGKRKALLAETEQIRMLVDTSAVEIYLNHGEVVFSSRYYGKTGERTLKIQADTFAGALWKL